MPRARLRSPWGTGDAALEADLVDAWFGPVEVAAAERLRERMATLREPDPLLATVAAAALGRALHDSGRDEDALAALARLDAAEAPAAAVRGLAIRSRACARLGRPAAATQAARSAAALAARHGLAATPAASLLHETAAAERRTERAGGEISRAELSVLRLLDSRLTQREIARELYLSPNTIKTHTAAVYRKLGVACRADAIAAARTLNLLPG